MSKLSSHKTPLIALVIFFALGITAAITQGSIIQPTSPTPQIPTYDQMNEQFQFLVFFYSKAFLQHDRAQITIPFGYRGKPPLLFTGFDPSDSNQRQVYLFSHPQITNLDWDQLKQDELTLFQKKPTYDSVSAFIANPPQASEIAVDIIYNSLHPSFKQSANTESEIDLEQINYILTNYTPPKAMGGDVYVYQHTVDSSNASINNANQIEWFVKAPLANEENTYRLGNIQVDYLQH